MTKQLLLASAFVMATLCAFAQNNTTDEGVEINGIVWATRNVDAPGTFAENPEDAGMFFQWNRRVGWPATGYEWPNPMPGWDSSNPEGTEWYAENDPCPAGWRVPTNLELISLRNAGHEWTTENGVNGRKFGTAPYQIFLPAVGVRDGGIGAFFDANERGAYWTSTPHSNLGAVDLLFNSSFTIIADAFRPNGLSVRCVKREPSTSINTPPAETNRTIVAFYNVLGQRLGQAPQRGIYIVVFDNGTAERRMR